MSLGTTTRIPIFWRLAPETEEPLRGVGGSGRRRQDEPQVRVSLVELFVSLGRMRREEERSLT